MLVSGRGSPQSLWNAEGDGRTEDTRLGTEFGILRSFLIPVFHNLESTTTAMDDGQELETTTFSLTLEEGETEPKKPRAPFGSR